YEYLEKMQDRIIRFLVDNSNIKEDNLRELMFRTGELVRDVGTVLVGREAVRAGIIDEVGGLSQAVHALRTLIQQRSSLISIPAHPQTTFQAVPETNIQQPLASQKPPAQPQQQSSWVAGGHT